MTQSAGRLYCSENEASCRCPLQLDYISLRRGLGYASSLPLYLSPSLSHLSTPAVVVSLRRWMEKKLPFCSLDARFGGKMSEGTVQKLPLFIFYIFFIIYLF